MKEETAKLISNGLLHMLQEVGIDPKEFARDLGRFFTGRTLSGADLSVATRTFQECWNNDILEKLKKAPDPSPQQLAQLLAGFKNFAPHMRQLLMEKAKSLRKRGAGGAPRLLAKNNAEARLCAMISQDRSGGTETPKAIQNAAVRFGVSYWTAKRAWKRYVETLDHSQARRARSRSPKA